MVPGKNQPSLGRNQQQTIEKLARIYLGQKLTEEAIDDGFLFLFVY